jgi:hypothetical protein
MRVIARSTPLWVGNTLGQDHLKGVVPPPWTPLAISAATVSCWGRSYSFGNATALPVQIQSQGTDLLAEPIALGVFVNGATRPMQWFPGEPISELQGNAASASLHRRAYATLGHSTITLATNATVEYDGFTWFCVSLSGFQAGAIVDGIYLDIPVRSEVALYSHRTLAPNDPFATTHKSYSGPAIRQNGTGGLVDWAEGFIPFWWLGNNDVGLQWTVEDARAWPNWNNPDTKSHLYPVELRQIVVTPTSSVMLQRLRLLRNQALPSDWKFEFGLQATPVKALPGNWRKWRPRSNRPDAYNDPFPAIAGTMRAVEVGGQDPDRGWTVAFGYPEIDPSHVASYNAMATTIHQAAGKVAQYELLTEMSTFSPEWSVHGPSWCAIPGGPCDLNGYPNGAALCNTNPASSFADFIVWKSHEFLASSGADGFYHDQTVLYIKMPGWIGEAKTVHPTYPIRAYRDLYRRVYTIAKKTAPAGLLCANMSGEMNIAVLAYEDACLDGEQLFMRLSDGEKYIDRYIAGSTTFSLEEFRAEFMGRQWGVIPFFYPYSNPYGADGGVGAAATDELLAILMLHDVGLFGDFADTPRVQAAYASLDTFGVVEATFTPYFASPPPVQTGTPNVYGSAYKRPDGHALVVLSNFNGTDVLASVQFNPIYFPTISNVESWTPSPTATIAPANGIYAVTVPGQWNATESNPRAYKLLHLTP